MRSKRVTSNAFIAMHAQAITKTFPLIRQLDLPGHINDLQFLEEHGR